VPSLHTFYAWDAVKRMEEAMSYLTESSWACIALLCGVLELFFHGFWLIRVTLAALITALLTYLLGFDPFWQLGLFTLFMAILWGIAQRQRAIPPPEAQGPKPGQALIGETLVISEPIINGHGTVRVGETNWRALGPDAPAGCKVRVVGVVGTGLKIVPLQG